MWPPNTVFAWAACCVLPLALSVAGVSFAGAAVIGVLLGLGLKAVGVPLIFSGVGTAVAFGCAVGTGVVFGFMPARQAARLDPVKALAGT